MPPKAARGGASRGRGRGRGKAAASSESDVMTGLLGETANETSSQSTLEDSFLPTAKITAPQQLIDDDSIPSPNSSPASIPTETPAPTPARMPIPRSEPAIASKSHVTGPSVRGGRGGARGAKPAAPSRFKPKNVRSDATKLEEIARKEQAKLNELAAEKAREQARLLRARGRPARGRGDVMGRMAGRPTATASGTFSVMPEALKHNPELFAKSLSSGGGGKKGAGGPSGSSGPSGSGGRGGGGNGGSSGGHAYEPEYPGQEDNDAPRIDIETINISSDDDDPIYTGTRPVTNRKGRAVSSKGGLKPIRLHREEHKERVTVVNTESSAKPAPEEEDDDLLTIDELRSAKAAGRDEKSSPKAKFIKYEEDDGDMQMTVRSSEPPSSAPPEAKRKIKESNASIPSIHPDAGPDVSDDAVAKAKRDKKVREVNKKKDKKPVIQTAQDRAEYERHLEDVAILANELGGLQGNLHDRANNKDVEGDVEMEGTVDDEPDKKEGRLYLFQFPPVLPELYNPVNGKPKAPAEIKAEELEGAKEKGKQKENEVGSKPDPKGKGKAKEKVEPAVEPAGVKVEAEPVLSPEERKKKEEEEKRKKRQGFVHEEGHIGKLVVRESGKVELCWGGTSLAVGRGVDAGFLTTGVVVDSLEKGPPGGGAPEGKALSMGQIMGKFVVTPDWQKMT